MRYTTLGNTGLKVSTLGFGCMRLPMNGSKVDREKSTPLLRRAVELGVTLFDSAIGYCNSDSQAAVGDALHGIRDKVIISTKNHHSDAPADAWWGHLEDSLRLLQTDYIDLYHHHGIGWETFVKHLDPDKGGRTREMIKAKEQGLIRHMAFSFHDTPENLIKLIDTGIYENVILQYNLLDQANADAILYAHEKGMGVVVMGPVGGGRLGLSSDKIAELTKGQSAPKAALRFVWAHPGVNVALSGMENLTMLEENVSYAETAGSFSKDEITGLNALVSERKKKSGLYCTACRYCMPACAQGVKIPENLDLLNQTLIYGLLGPSKERYGWLDGKAVACINCGKCVPLCPQGIKIPEKLAQAAQLLDPSSGSVPMSVSLRELDADGNFTLAVKLFNFFDKPQDVKIRFASSTGMSIANDAIEVAGFKAMARKTVTVSGKMPIAEGRQTASADLIYDGVSHPVAAASDMLIVKNGAQSWVGGTWFESQPTADDFSSSKESADKHGFKFKLVRDDHGLILMADVKDDFLAPSIETKHKGALVDCLELYLDGRGEKLGGKSYENGVFQIQIYPGTPGSSKAFYHCSQGQGLGNLGVESERTPNGYRMTIKIPFASFYLGSGRPERIGFDLAANTADASGNRIAQYVFAGTKDNWRDASKFIPVCLM